MVIRRNTPSTTSSQTEMESAAFTGVFFILWAIIIVLIV